MLPQGEVAETHSSRGHAALLAGIALLATMARLWGISAESLWLDEATSLMLARLSVPDLVAWTAVDIHPPLYYTLLHYWILLGQNETVVRGLSALAGVLTVLVIYGLGRAWFGQRAGLIAAALLAVNPYHVWYSQEARMYALVALLMGAAVLAAFHLWESGSRWAWAAHVLATAAAWYTHYYAVFGILLVNLMFAYLLVRRRVDRRLLWRWIAAQAAILVLFAPWLPTFLLPITVGGGGWLTAGGGRPGLRAIPETVVLYMVSTGRALYPVWVRRLGYVLVLGLASLGVWWGARRRAPGALSRRVSEREATLFCLVYLALPLGLTWGVSQIFKPMYSARYMLPFLLPLLLLVARGIAGVPVRWLRWGALAGASVLMAIGVGLQVRLADKPDWRGLAAQITAEAQPGDLVVFMPGWHAKPFAYYAGDAVAQFDGIPIPVSRYPQEAPKALAQAIAGHPRVWFVWEEGHYTDPEGIIYRYLAEHCREMESRPFALVGRVILFANPAALGGG